MTIFLVTSILVLLGVWLVLRARSRAASDAMTKPVVKSRYSAVSVRGPVTACDAAKCIGDERYLASASPDLPLANCDKAATCECYFAVYDDRRRNHDRRSPYSVSTVNSGTGVFKEERRQGIERRSKFA